MHRSTNRQTLSGTGETLSPLPAVSIRTASLIMNYLLLLNQVYLC